MTRTIQLNAVAGVTGRFSSDGKLSSLGIQCALCQSTVDDSFAPGIGHRLDGLPAGQKKTPAVRRAFTWLNGMNGYGATGCTT